MGRRLKKALDLLSVHDGLQHSRCDVCEKMRSYAWGMGHANWEERRCGGWVQGRTGSHPAQHSQSAVQL